MVLVRQMFVYINLSDHHPAGAPGVMSLREAEGPLGTVDLPVPEATPVMVQEPEVAPEQLVTV